MQISVKHGCQLFSIAHSNGGKRKNWSVTKDSSYYIMHLERQRRHRTSRYLGCQGSMLVYSKATKDPKHQVIHTYRMNWAYQEYFRFCLMIVEIEFWILLSNSKRHVNLMQDCKSRHQKNISQEPSKIKSYNIYSVGNLVSKRYQVLISYFKFLQFVLKLKDFFFLFITISRIKFSSFLMTSSHGVLCNYICRNVQENER